MARRVDYYFRETLAGIRRNGLVAFAAVSTVFIAAFLFGGAQLIGKQIGLVTGQQLENVSISVYLDDNISAAQHSHLSELLSSMPEVRTVRYESKQEAYEHAKILFKNQPDILNNVNKDTFPASFRVKLVDPERDFAVVAAQLAGQPGIERIFDARDILKRLFAVANVLKRGAYIATGVMLLSAIALIANTVRMAVFARRKEIGIMRLVGATNWFIRLPFMIEAVVEGLGGAILAVLALTFLKNSFFNDFHSTLGFWPVIGNQDLITVIPWLLAGGVLVALFASWIAMRRFLEV
jgi:cell division transport system permease protein